MLEGLSRTVIELSDLPSSRKPDEWPATIDLSGLEQFGGVKAAAALIAPSPLWLYRNIAALDASLAPGSLLPRRSRHKCSESSQTSHHPIKSPAGSTKADDKPRRPHRDHKAPRPSSAL